MVVAKNPLLFLFLVPMLLLLLFILFTRSSNGVNKRETSTGIELISIGFVTVNYDLGISLSGS